MDQFSSDANTFIVQRAQHLQAPAEMPALPGIVGSRLAIEQGAELELYETLGEGGMGVVKRACQVPLGRIVAGSPWAS
ncbi:MAG: hypothetical protein H0U74_00155 [Bradymonadaceae bacterium]|nr:hypothetical protein [Lujinxingiaceae bacterium]